MVTSGGVKRVRRKKRPPVLYQYQQDGRYFAQIADSIKEAGVEELAELGAADIQPEFSGIRFRADRSTLYRINYQTRLLSRCLAPLVSFACPDTDTLYRRAGRIAWQDFIALDQTFAVTANVSDSAISHSKYATLRLKDAVVDYFKTNSGRRPNVSVKSPETLLNLHIRHNQAVISLDVSGGALHRRGYREESVAAPMQETVAAAIIRFTRWDGSVPLYDPMCGSGTLLCEALMRHCNIPAGVFRSRFGFESLPDFSRAVWQQAKAEAEANRRHLPSGLIGGSDASAGAVRASRTNLMGLPDGNMVEVDRVDFKDLPTLRERVIVVNPPYGIRMGGDEDLVVFYKSFGDFLKQKCRGSTAYVYFGERRYIKNIGLKTSWKKPITAGGLDGRLVKYEIY